ncbi:unnamed protein product [Rhizoctonia solani]|uniref:Uncharacterized protein n=1 Tax=Rhizoctonia solani TaxID=456999 RepID=A0A8H3A0C5_9AGAM|nr:unnamed protein product [Rhizoctonia solani]
MSKSLPLSAPDLDAVDNILYELITSVKQYKSPSELDFSPNGENPMHLLINEKNNPFLDQLRKLDDLRTQLAKISTQGNEKLEDKHKLTNMAIERALYRMKEHQLELYRKRPRDTEAPSKSNTWRNCCIAIFIVAAFIFFVEGFLRH